jgi:hypothetical protein
LRAAWPHARADWFFHAALRALVVAAVLAVVLVLALWAEIETPMKTADKPARVARVNVAPSSPFMTLTRRGDDFPLDSDFSLDQAALTWSHRLGARSARGDEADPPGTMRFGPVRVSRSIVERVVKAAKSTEIDPALLMAIADKESSFSPSAKASTSSASGLFQFIESTWLKALRTFGWRYGHEEIAKAIRGEEHAPRVAPEKRAEILNLRNDPYLSAALAAEMLKHDGAKIVEMVGRALTAGETYLIHFLGPDDAARFIKKLDEEPQASAAQLLPRPARANRPIFYEQQGGKMKDRSVQEVHAAFETMMGQRSSRYEGVERRLPEGAMAYSEEPGQIAKVGSLEPAAGRPAAEPPAAKQTAAEPPAAKRTAAKRHAAEPPAAKRSAAKRAIARASIADSAQPRRTRPCRDCRAAPRERHAAAPRSQKQKLPVRRHR